MRQTLLLVAALALPAVAVAAPPSTSRLVASGFGVASVIHHEANGVVTEGYLFGIDLLHGANPDIPWPTAIAFFGTQYDPATGNTVTFTGAAPVTYSPNGLDGAHLTGNLQAFPFYDGSNLPPDPLPPIDLAVDLAFTGTGSTHSDTAVFSQGSKGSVYVLYQSGRWRYATITGSATVDGSSARVDTAQLLAQTSGEFNLVVLHQ